MRLGLGLGLAGLLVTVFGCETFISRPSYPPPPPPPPPPVGTAPSPRPILYVNANRLNLRACPGMDCPKVSTLERNDEVEKMAEAEDWAQVLVKRDGSIGWVAARYLSDRPVPMEMAPAPPAPGIPAEAPPETVQPPRPPAPEKPKTVKPAETILPKPTPKPAEAAEPKAAPPPKKPEATAKPPAPAKEPELEPPKPAPAAPEPAPETPKRIRIM